MTIRAMVAAALTAVLMLAAGGLHAQQEGSQGRETAIFGGGCFWCVEEAFDALDGVVETTSGYTGGEVKNPTYRQVSAGGTGHYEAVRVRYDPARISYEKLLDTFWRNIDPFDAGGQFCDRGSSYKSAVFVSDGAQRRAAKKSKAAVAERFEREIATPVLDAATFWPAEDYHQNYHNKNPVKYKFYKWNCGRAQRLEEIWGAKQG